MPAPATEASFKHDSAAGVWRYELKPGDVLRVTVWRRPEFTGEFLVGPNGVLEHPLYQNVPVSNLPPDSVRANVQAFLSRYETTPQFYVEPLFRILVGGQVHAPGLINVPQSTTIPQAVALAGGPASRCGHVRRDAPPRPQADQLRSHGSRLDPGHPARAVG